MDVATSPRAERPLVGGAAVVNIVLLVCLRCAHAAGLIRCFGLFGSSRDPKRTRRESSRRTTRLHPTALAGFRTYPTDGQNILKESLTADPVGKTTLEDAREALDALGDLSNAVNDINTLVRGPAHYNPNGASAFNCHLSPLPLRWKQATPQWPDEVWFIHMHTKHDKELRLHKPIPRFGGLCERYQESCRCRGWVRRECERARHYMAWVCRSDRPLQR